MPIYDYVCSACGRDTEVVHGIHETGPGRCPACGAEGTMRKRLSPPAVVYKGTGWARKERGGKRSESSSRPKTGDAGGSSGGSGGAGGSASGTGSSSGDGGSTGSGEGTASSASKPAGTSGGGD